MYANHNKEWTKEQVEYLKDNWGKIHINTIVKNIGKTKGSIYSKAYRLGLGKQSEYDGSVSLAELSRLLMIDISTMYSYADKFGLNYVKKKVDNKIVKCVYISEFYKWAEHNTNLIDCTNIPQLYLGPEPEWLKLMRLNKSTLNATNQVKKQMEWSSVEESKLKIYAMSNKYTITELAKKMERSETSVSIRLSKLGLSHHLVIDDRKSWTREDEELLLASVSEYKLKTRTCDWSKVSEVLHRSENSCRTKYRYMKYNNRNNKRIQWGTEDKNSLMKLTQMYTTENCDIDWAYIAEELHRTVDACKSQYNRLRA